MTLTHKILLKKNYLFRLLSSFVFTFLFLITTPILSLKIGNIFFFSVPRLYNATFANFFYTYAAYPLLGESVPYAHHQRSRVLFVQGKLDAALLEANKELSLYPENTETYYLLGLTYGYLQQNSKAIESFTSFIESHPDTWAGRNDKAWLQFRTGDIMGSFETIEPVAITQTTNPWVQNTYCAILINLGKFKEAKIACERAKKTIDGMPKEIWGKAYPGNDPRIYEKGLLATKFSINENLTIINNKITALKKR